MLYVALVTPAGELVDPPGYPHLSFAVAQASLSGTDTIGTRSWIEERRINRDIDIYRAEVREYEARGETPPTSTTTALERAVRERTILLDESEWLRRVQDAPSIDFAMRELEDAMLVQVTTVPEGFASVCRLLLDRRENARLRSLERDYPRVYERRQSEARTGRARLHAEIRDLAFTGLGRRAPRDESPIPLERARELYFRTQNPAASYFVITGGFDAAAVRKFLENQFAPDQPGGQARAAGESPRQQPRTQRGDSDRQPDRTRHRVRTR